jgi:hypothetical protein
MLLAKLGVNETDNWGERKRNCHTILAEEHSHRLSKSYEHLTRTDETWISIAMARLMLNRLA